MKSRIFLLTTLLSLALFACQSNSEKTADESSAVSTVSADAPDVSGTFTVESGSTLAWRGSKPVGKEHNGTIDIAGGSIKVVNGLVTGGEFTIDMTTIKDLDLEPGSGQDLGNYSITGDLTIKGITNSINFPAQITVSENGVSTSAKASFQIDRSKWNVKFGSTNFFEDLVGDKIISNEIDIELDFVTKAVQS